MKKIKYLFFLLILCFPFFVKAEGIIDYKIDATLLENGDLEIQEYFYLSGKYNGFERIINYKNSFLPEFDSNKFWYEGSALHNGSGIELKEIKGVPIDESFDFTKIKGDLFSKVKKASKGDYGVYTEEKTEDGVVYQIYNPGKKDKAFYLHYLVKDVGIVHQDVGELGWNLIGNELSEPIENFTATIHFPGNTGTLRGWAHGPLYGEVRIVSNEEIKVTVENLDAYNAIDVRATFDPNIISNAKKRTNADVLNQILIYENQVAADANEQRELEFKKLIEKAEAALTTVETSLKGSDLKVARNRIRALPDGIEKVNLLKRLQKVEKKVKQKEEDLLHWQVPSSILLAVFLLVWSFYVYKNYDKEYKSNFKEKYFRDFPSNLSPAMVGYLIRKKIGTEELSASILDLIEKKKIVYETLSKEDKDYLLKKNCPMEELNENDKLLIDLLFGIQDQITLKAIKANADMFYDDFLEKYQAWIASLTKEGKNHHFFEKIFKIKRTNVLLCVFLILCYGYLFFCQVDFVFYLTWCLLPLGGLLLSFGYLIYTFCFEKRTKEANEEYHQWMALKQFMKDFSQMDKRDLPQIELWEKYLVYAVVLNCADQLAKDMEIQVQSISPEFSYYDYRTFLFFSSMSQSLNTLMEASIQVATNARAIANSSSSSGSGFGGGFSSGGGSFGGGGGGGRF